MPNAAADYGAVPPGEDDDDMAGEDDEDTDGR